HARGRGAPLDERVVRAILALRANCLARGHSGLRLETLERMLAMLQAGIVPFVPEKGSVGASGDLAPLSHIALALIGEGDVEVDGKIMRSDFAIHNIDLKPVVLGPKDGLALINGTSVMLALGCLALVESKRLVKLADIISCLTLDAVR